jgi:hypothetical protein
MTLPVPTPNERRKNLLAAGACAAMLIAYTVICWTAWLGKSAVYDEPLHFMGAWIQTHDGDFRCNPEDPPLWKFYVAAGTSGSDLTIPTTDFWNEMLKVDPGPSIHLANLVLYQTPANDAEKVLRAARARMLFLGVILGASIGWWAWRLAGRFAAIVAIAAFSFDPNFLAHSLLVKNDVPITLVFVILMGLIWLAGERATALRIAGVILLVAVALTTKFSGLLAIPILAIALACRVAINRPWPVLRWTLATRLHRSYVAALILLVSISFGYFFIWACYGFRFGPSLNPSELFDFSRSSTPILDAAKSEMILRQDPVPLSIPAAQMQQWLNEWRPSATVRLVQWLNHHRIFPQSWLYGFLYTYATSLTRPGFLCGEIRLDGWWYYFPFAMAFKTPLATIIGLALAAILFFARLRNSKSPLDPWAICAAIIFPAIYFLVAIRSHLNIGLRHILPVYPFLFILLGVMAVRAGSRRRKMTNVAVTILFLGLLSETLAAYPNFIPFFNIAAGGSRGGLSLLSDSNIDWGQDLPSLGQWQRNHPDRQLWLSQFALPDPRYYGIRYVQMPGATFYQPDLKPNSIYPNVYAISPVSLQGTYIPADQHYIYAHFLDQHPFEILNGTIYLFNSPPK